MNFHDSAPATPCIKVCVVDPLSGLCIGCGRTIAEISLWPEMSEDERRAVMSGLPQRMEAGRSRTARASRVGRRERQPWR
jgi:predicted Fe-S protein YdhL (DUF1289 family)